MFNRSVILRPSRVVVGGSHHTYVLQDGKKIDDFSGGAAVACLGRVQELVTKVVCKQMKLGLSYVPSLAFDTVATLDLAEFLIASTNGHMSKAIFYCSGNSTSNPWGHGKLTFLQALKHQRQR